MNKEDREWLVKIGTKLMKMRIDRGYQSMESFAYDHGLARSYYWQVEKGRKNTGLLYLKKLCAIHATTVEEFLSEL